MPVPVPVILILVPAFASDAFAANWIVLWSTLITKYTVPVDRPPIFPPPPFVYVTLDPVKNLWLLIVIVSATWLTTLPSEPLKVVVNARSSKILKLLFSPVALRLP